MLIVEQATQWTGVDTQPTLPAFKSLAKPDETSFVQLVNIMAHTVSTLHANQQDNTYIQIITVLATFPARS